MVKTNLSVRVRSVPKTGRHTRWCGHATGGEHMHLPAHFFDHLGKVVQHIVYAGRLQLRMVDAASGGIDSASHFKP
jgi:hypothetical protein